MKQKTTILTIILIVAAVAAGIGCYFWGRSTVLSQMKAEQELNIKINRSELDGLGKIEGTIYITGHMSPDSDSVGSAIAYANLLRQLGYDARPVVTGEINKETQYVLKQAGLEAPELLTDATGLNMILVDHSGYAQSVEGLEDANVISIIDHHGTGSVTTGNQLVYDARPLGATAMIIWIRYRNYGLQPDRQTAIMMLGSLMSDTNNLTEGTYTFADQQAYEDLKEIAGITDTDAFYVEMNKASISYEGMTDEEIFFSDYLEYEAGDVNYGVGCVSAYDDDIARDLADRMKDVIDLAHDERGMDMAFVQISIFHDGLSVVYLVPSNEEAAAVIEQCFGSDAVFDGTSYRIEPGFSRKKVLIPAITDALEDHR